MTELIAQKPTFRNSLNQGFTLGFYLAYHGKSDVVLKRQLAELYMGALTDTQITSFSELGFSRYCKLLNPGTHEKKVVLGSGVNRIKVGFISRFFTAHSIGRLMQGVISQLDKSKFEIIIFMVTGNTAEEARDTIATRIIEAADHVVHLPDTLLKSHEVIALHHCHIIIYPEIGLDPFTYYLALSRLAPVQVYTQ